jgi:ribosome-associated protein
MITNSKIQIPDFGELGRVNRELVFKTSRSSGPGGQNVNKLNTKVSLIFDIPNSSTLTGQQKQTILRKLAGRLTKDKRLIITSQKFRTQNANRRFAVKRLAEIVQKALEKPKLRRPTKPTVSAIEKRLQSKKTRSLLKQQRRKIEL